MWRSVFYKELRLLMTPVFFVALAVAWFALGWFLISGLLEYQAIAAKLAALQNRRGATETLLGSATKVIQWLMILWTLYFGARSLANEKQWHTHLLLCGMQQAQKCLLILKTLVLIGSVLLLTLPFWLFVLWVMHSSIWDGGLLISQALGQIFIAVYAGLLALTVSASRHQALPASLLLALIWLLLWLAPVLTTTPLWLVELLRWFSPFEHAALLYRGILSSQTLVFIIIHGLLFATLMPIFWAKDSS